MKITFQHPSCSDCQVRIKSVFCELPDNELENMSIEKSCMSYKKGQYIFSEGNNPSGLFCVNAGIIKTYKTGNDGKEQILRLVREGDILGYRSLISGERYNASAVAMEDSVICSIPKKTFFEILESNSSVSNKILKLLSGDLKSAENFITSLAQKNVRERVAETIIMLKEFYGTGEDGQTINNKISREDFANITGTATESTIRELSDLRKEKVIEFAGKEIKILNMDKLMHIANLMD
jgi:CRP/FNR family transcriptional regulator